MTKMEPCIYHTIGWQSMYVEMAWVKFHNSPSIPRQAKKQPIVVSRPISHITFISLREKSSTWISQLSCHLYYWSTGASLPSHPNSVICIGEQEQAYLVIQTARLFCKWKSRFSEIKRNVGIADHEEGKCIPHPYIFVFATFDSLSENQVN